MGKFNNYLSTNLLDHVWGNSPYGAPSTLYFALMTAPADKDDSGSTISEATYGGYARASVTNNGTNFTSATTPASLATKVNGTSIEFPEVTNGTNTITDVAILDSGTLSAGNILASGTLTVSKSISTGDKLIFEPSGVTITLD